MLKMKKVLVEIEFECPVNPKMIPDIISNRDAVLLTGSNITNIRVLEEAGTGDMKTKEEILEKIYELRRKPHSDPWVEGRLFALRWVIEKSQDLQE